MNLSNFFEEGDISNFENVEDKDVFSCSNIDLEEIDKVNRNKKSEKKENKDLINNKKSCLKDISIQFSKGKTAKEVKSFILSKYSKEYLPDNFDDMLKKQYGIIGTILADCSSFEQKSDYNLLPPSLKINHQYAIRCNCNRKKSKIKREIINGGTVDAFLKNDDDWSEIPIASICPKTGLPVLEDINDYSKNDAIKVLDRLYKQNSISKKEKDELLSKYSPIVSVKKAFQMIDDKRIKSKKTNDVVQNFNMNLGKDGNILSISKKAKEGCKINNLNLAELDVKVNNKPKTSNVVSELKENKVSVSFNKNRKSQKVEIHGEKDIPVEIERKSFCVDVPMDGSKIIPVEIQEELVPEKIITDFKDPEIDIKKIKNEKSLIIPLDTKVNIPFELNREQKLDGEVDLNSDVDEDWFEKDKNIEIDFDESESDFDVDGSQNWRI